MDEFIFSKWGRFLGALTCASMVFTVCDFAREVGLLDFANDVHWRGRTAAMFWGAVLGWLLSPPSGIYAGFISILIGMAVGLGVGAGEITVSYVLHGFQLPSFDWLKVAMLIFIPAAFSFIVAAFLKSPSTREHKRSVTERLASHPVLSLLVSAATVAGTAVAIWPEFAARMRELFQ